MVVTRASGYLLSTSLLVGLLWSSQGALANGPWLLTFLEDWAAARLTAAEGLAPKPDMLCLMSPITLPPVVFWAGDACKQHVSKDRKGPNLAPMAAKPPLCPDFWTPED